MVNHCRICGTSFPRGCKDKKAKGTIQTLIKACYNIDVSREDSHVCLKCFAEMRRVEAARGIKYINPAVVVFNWQPHTDDCEICIHFTKCKKGGPPNKSRKNRGCVAGETPTQTVTSIRSLAGECLVTAAINPDRISMSQVDHLYLVCHLVVNEPVQLSCERLVCGECITHMLLSKGPSVCPSCGAPATSAHFGKCPSVVADLLGNL